MKKRIGPSMFDPDTPRHKKNQANPLGVSGLPLLYCSKYVDDHLNIQPEDITKECNMTFGGVYRVRIRGRD